MVTQLATKSPVTTAYKSYLQSLYRATLKSASDWYRHDEWRRAALVIRYQFDLHKTTESPAAMAEHLRSLEALEYQWRHPDPYHHPTAPGGTKWERHIPPRLWTSIEREAAIAFTRPKFDKDTPAYPDWYSEAFDPQPVPQWFTEDEIGPEWGRAAGVDWTNPRQNRRRTRDPLSFAPEKPK